MQTVVLGQLPLSDPGPSPSLNLSCKGEFDPPSARYRLIGMFEVPSDPLVLDSTRWITNEVIRESEQMLPVGRTWNRTVFLKASMCV